MAISRIDLQLGRAIGLWTLRCTFIKWNCNWLHNWWIEIGNKIWWCNLWKKPRWWTLHKCCLEMFQYFTVNLYKNSYCYFYTNSRYTLIRWLCIDCFRLCSGSTACIIFPIIVLHLLQCHGSSASLRFCLTKACFPTSCLYCTDEPRGKYLSPASCHNILSHLVPSLSLLIASFYFAHSITSGSIFVSISRWITGGTQKTIWHDVVLKRAPLCDAILPCLL